MRRPILIIITILLALGAIEGVAYWWMHPKPAGLGEPVLVYRPGIARELSVVSGQLSEEELSEKSQPPAPGLTPDKQQSTIDNQLSTISPSSTTTLLSDVVAAALPSLRCTTGTAARIDRDDDVTIHVAFFEWDLSSSTNVLEAFKHLPEECMGSIGMTLIEKAPVRTFVVRGTEDRLSVVGGQLSEKELSQKSPSPAPERSIANRQPTTDNSPSSTDNSSTDNRQPTTDNSSSSTDNSSTDNRQPTTDNSPSPSDNGQPTTDNSSSSTLTFDHTVFRDQGGAAIHAFKGTWVSGATDLLGPGARGGVEQWTQIRWKAALKRFRPAHARVVQGAVRGIRDPDLAWEAFEKAMLRDLSFQ